MGEFAINVTAWEVNDELILVREQKSDVKAECKNDEISNGFIDKDDDLRCSVCRCKIKTKTCFTQDELIFSKYDPRNQPIKPYAKPYCVSCAKKLRNKKVKITR